MYKMPSCKLTVLPGPFYGQIQTIRSTMGLNTWSITKNGYTMLPVISLCAFPLLLDIKIGIWTAFLDSFFLVCWRWVERKTVKHMLLLWLVCYCCKMKVSPKVFVIANCPGCGWAPRLPIQRFFFSLPVGGVELDTFGLHSLLPNHPITHSNRVEFAERCLSFLRLIARIGSCKSRCSFSTCEN